MLPTPIVKQKKFFHSRVGYKKLLPLQTFVDALSLLTCLVIIIEKNSTTLSLFLSLSFLLAVIFFFYLDSRWEILISMLATMAELRIAFSSSSSSSLERRASKRNNGIMDNCMCSALIKIVHYDVQDRRKKNLTLPKIRKKNLL